MRALITGAAGQLAGQMARSLSAVGSEYLALGRAEMDISDLQQALDAVNEFKPDFIFNCAAYNLVDKAEEQWDRAFAVNATGPENLLRASKATGCILVHFSTDYVFDGSGQTPYTIAHKPNPLNAYGRSKLMGEQAIQQRDYPRHYIIRLSWVFGNGENSFVNKLLGWADRQQELRIVDDQISSPSYAGDIAAGVLDLIKTDSFGLYHMSNSGHCSRHQWAEFILGAIGWKGSLLPAKSADFPGAAARPPFSAMDNYPLGSVIGRTLPHWQNATKRYLKEAGRI